MSRRTFVPILLTWTVIVLFGAATTAAGSDGDSENGPRWPGTWICAHGTLAFAGADSTTIELAGSIQPCTGTDPATVAGARWGFATYHTAGAFVQQGGVRQFESATAPTAFDVSVMIDGSEAAASGPLRAVCLITAPNVRHACVEVTTESDGALYVGPISTHDLRVTGRVSVVSGPGPDPECGACV